MAASIPFFLIQEGYTDGHLMPAGVARKRWTVDKEGYASLPEGPGLGVEVNEKGMARVAADPKVKFVWPLMRLRDGSVADY